MNNKREYLAASAMNLPQNFIEPTLIDEDMIEDVDGGYEKHERGYYYVPSGNFPEFPERKKYTIRTSFEYRLSRELFKIADAMIERSNFPTYPQKS